MDSLIYCNCFKKIIIDIIGNVKGKNRKMAICPKVVYFDRWMDPAGPEILAGKNPNIVLEMIDVGETDYLIWENFGSAHGYQMLPSTETEEKFYPNASFIERCPSLLCVSSSGAGYDQVDVDACSNAGILLINPAG